MKKVLLNSLVLMMIFVEIPPALGMWPSLMLTVHQVCELVLFCSGRWSSSIFMGVDKEVSGPQASNRIKPQSRDHSLSPMSKSSNKLV